MCEMELGDLRALRAEVDKIEMPEAVYARLVALIDGAPRICVKADGEKKTPSKKSGTGKQAAGVADMYEQIAAIYREMCPELPGVRDMTDARRRAMHARCEAAPEGQLWTMWRELFGHVRRSSFLRGNNARGWRANLDWLINPTNFDKVMSGAYDDRGTAGNAAGSFDTEEFFNMALERGRREA